MVRTCSFSAAKFSSKQRQRVFTLLSLSLSKMWPFSSGEGHTSLGQKAVRCESRGWGVVTPESSFHRRLCQKMPSVDCGQVSVSQDGKPEGCGCAQRYRQ